jgi:hypothetical protein
MLPTAAAPVQERQHRLDRWKRTYGKGPAARCRGMMTAMTSLALLEHTATAASPPFNGLFYATIATIIPVLYIALAVQGDAYEPFLRAALTIARRSPSVQLHGIARNVVNQISLVIVGFILGGGVVGEIFTLYFLYNQKTPGKGGGLTVAVITVLLVALAAVGPVLKARKLVTDHPQDQADHITPAVGPSDSGTDTAGPG